MRKKSDVLIQEKAMNTFEEFDYLKNSSECSTVSASKTSLSSSSVEDVDSSQQLNAIPTQSSNKSAIDTESTCFISENTAIKTSRNAWKHQSISSEEDAINAKSTCVVSEEVVEKTRKRAWGYQSTSVNSEKGFAAKKVDLEKVAKARKLLDGAIALAWKNVKLKRKPPALTPTRWVWRLASSYHLTHFTPQIMEKASQRFASAGQKILAQWAAEKAREERGHDRLALLDIQSMGYEAEAVVEALIPPAAATLVNYFIQSAWNRDPINCVGYSYTMERLALGIGEKYIQQVESLLPSGIQATRCLRVHSSVGADAEHVEETLEMVAQLDFQERIDVAAACYETALQCFSSPKENYISDEELQNVLRPLQNIDNYG